MAMRILLLGKNGQLGWEFQRTLPPLGELRAVDYPEIDFSQPEQLRALVREYRPDVVINAAAYTAVDRAESEVELCTTINATAPAILAEETRTLNAALIHFSTDYVFDGRKDTPYTEKDLPNPLNFYGRTKLDGEKLIQHTGGSYWIFRTSWVYSNRRDSFVSKVLEWSHRQTELRIVDDQYGCPTWSRMLAEITTQALLLGFQNPAAWISQTTGLYHLAGSGHANRFEWASEIIQLDPNKSEQTVKTLTPVKTIEFPTPAERPLFAPMDCSLFSQVFGLRLPPWQRSLRLMMGA